MSDLLTAEEKDRIIILGGKPCGKCADCSTDMCEAQDAKTRKAVAEEIKMGLGELIIGIDKCEFKERHDGDKGCIVLDMNMNQWQDYFEKCVK